MRVVIRDCVISSVLLYLHFDVRVQNILLNISRHLLAVTGLFQPINQIDLLFFFLFFSLFCFLLMCNVSYKTSFLFSSRAELIDGEKYRKHTCILFQKKMGLYDKVLTVITRFTF